ncbi:MAG: 2-oxo acid dehydrogenase subunit E2 [Chloroflexi bacterium]|nr:MAG: 2-oxo acid dehydrogenase subunit E2 [Chloroflexota bacterium]MBL1194486.1 2-oxo acid dehydrogenase subunit E2 [Chloroflexota bacterium]NOH11774.1 2-oxo acid dehydrogenase subunit E2 [Chloroflexota bacterium]
MATKVILPHMGEAVTEATITQWLKKEGEQVEEYEALVEVNTDKVDSEVPSPVSGTILSITQPEGATVEVETTLAWIGEPGEEIPEDDSTTAPQAKKPAPAPPPQPAPMPAPAPSATPAASASASASPLVTRIAADLNVDLSKVPASGPGGRITKQDVLAYVENGAPTPAVAAPQAQPAPTNGDSERVTFISPVVARLAAENNVELNQVTGTGKGGRITKKDIQAFIEHGPTVAPQPATPAAATPVDSSHIPGTVEKLSPVRKSIAEHMVRSKHTSPHVTTVMEADLSKVFAHRAANKASFANDGAKLTFTAYFVAAAVGALKAYPLVNSSWTDEGIALHKDINVGMAAAIDDGLIVPVIKQADSMSLLGLARTVNDLAERARGKQLQPDEVAGGTFTITNHGTSGSLFATPIINQPQCAILGTGAIQKRAVVIDDAIAIRPMVYISLTFDHRILDGQSADNFLMHIVNTLQGWN